MLKCRKNMLKPFRATRTVSRSSSRTNAPFIFLPLNSLVIKNQVVSIFSLVVAKNSFVVVWSAHMFTNNFFECIEIKKFIQGEGFDKGADESEWVVNRERSDADTTFDSLGPVNGFISGRTAKEHMVKSKLPNSVLGKIWKLADVDKDGQLDADEFALANYLINLKLEGHELPNDLPKHLIPPTKREVQDPVYPKLEDEE